MTMNPNDGGLERVRTAGRWVLFSAILASSMAFIGESALSVSLPAIQAALGAGGSQLLWIVNAYTLLLASLILVGGSLGDQLGRRRVFMAGIVIFTIGSLACGLAPSARLLIGARLVQGLGGALMIPGSLAMITAFFPPERRGRAIGTWAAATTVTMIMGPLIGGYLAEAGLWRGIFLINLPLGLGSLVALWARVPESRDEDKERGIDWTGALLVVSGLAGLVYGFTTAPELGFGHPRILGALILGVLALAGFGVLERFRPNPMLPFGLFASRTFSGVNLLTFFLYGGLYSYILFFTLNLIQAQGYRESQAGYALLPFMVLLAGISRWSGKLLDRVGPRLPLILGPSLTAAGFYLHSLIGLTGGPREYWVTFFPAVGVVGLGMGLTVAPLTTTVMSAAGVRFAGTASGVNNSVSRIAGVLAIAVLGSVALFTFGTALGRRAADLDLPERARQELQAEAARLGEAEVPNTVPVEQFEETARALRASFVDTVRLMMIVCAGLAAAGAGLAALFVRGREEP